MVYCCFSKDKLTDEEKEELNPKEREMHDEAPEEPVEFQTSMCGAGCAEPCCCCLTFFSCSFGTTWCLRRKALDGDWSKYEVNALSPSPTIAHAHRAEFGVNTVLPRLLPNPMFRMLRMLRLLLEKPARVLWGRERAVLLHVYRVHNLPRYISALGLACL